MSKADAIEVGSAISMHVSSCMHAHATAVDGREIKAIDSLLCTFRHDFLALKPAC